MNFDLFAPILTNRLTLQAERCLNQHQNVFYKHVPLRPKQLTLAQKFTNTFIRWKQSKQISSGSKFNHQAKIGVSSTVWCPSQDGVFVSFSLLPLPKPHWGALFSVEMEALGAPATCPGAPPEYPEGCSGMLLARRSHQKSVKDGSGMPKDSSPGSLAEKTSAVMLFRPHGQMQKTR